MKAILHFLVDIDNRTLSGGGDWVVQASIPAFAGRLARSENTVRKYIREASSTPYLEVLRSSNTSHTFVIHWIAIVNQQTNPARDQAADCTDDEDDMRIDEPGGVQFHSPRGSVPSPEGFNSEFEGVQFEGFNSPHTPSENLLQRELKSNNHSSPSLPSAPSSTERPTERAPSLFPRHQRSRNRHEVRERTRAVCWPLWERAVAARNLANPEDVQQLFAIAIELEIVTDCEQNRFRVFCQAAKQVRMCRSGQATTRFGLFVSNVAKNTWFCNQDDEQTARLMIHRADLHLSPAAAEGRREIESVCAATVQGIPAEVEQVTRQQADAKKELARLKLAEKFPELFNIPY